MATFSRIKVWVSNEVLTAADLNGEFNNIINNMGPDGIEDASVDVAAMQANVDPGGVGSESLATNLRGEIQRLRYTIKRIVGGAQWYSAPVIDLSSLITTAKIADANVTTAKLADGAVTQAKRAALGEQISSSTGNLAQITSVTQVDITNLTATITTTGRLVRIEIVSDGTANLGSDYARIWAHGDCYLLGLRGATEIGTYNIKSPASPNEVKLPSSSFAWYDKPAAGTYTYKIQGWRDSLSGTGLNVKYSKLVVYEL